jgi:valyl-tRNA synthetase
VPAYNFAGENDITWIAAHNSQQAIEFAKHHGLSYSIVNQDEDVLDTWFSSSLFPFSVCGWPEQVT